MIMDTDVFRKNRAFLEGRYPAVLKKIESSPGLPIDCKPFTNSKGQVNLSVKTAEGVRWWYDTDDIVKTIKSTMKEWSLDGHDHLIVVGIGLGYQALLAVNEFSHLKGSDRPGIIVFEPFPEMVHIAMQLMDLRRLFAYADLQLYIGENQPENQIMALGYDFFMGKQRIVVDAGTRAFYGEKFSNFETRVTTNVGLVRDLWHTTKVFGPRIFQNTMRNLPSLFDGQALGRLKGQLRGVPAFCIAAGPSLDEALPALKRIGNKALLVAIDSAVPGLVSAGVMPHVVATADVRDINFRKYRAYLHQLRHAVLLYAIESNPSNVGHFLGKRRIAVSIDNPVLDYWLEDIWHFDCALPAMTTSSHTALFSLLEMGADPIYLVGMDMSFPSGQSHSKSVMHPYRLQHTDLMAVAGNSNNSVLTYQALNNYRIQIETVLRAYPQKVVNTCLNGARIQGTEVEPIDSATASVMEFRTPVDRILSSIDWKSGITPSMLSDQIKTKIKELDKCSNDCNKRLMEISRDNDDINMMDDRIDVNDEIKKIEKSCLMVTRLMQGVYLSELRQIDIKRMLLNKNKAKLKNDEKKKILIDYVSLQKRMVNDVISKLNELIRYYEKYNAIGVISGSDISVDIGYRMIAHLIKNDQSYKAVDLICKLQKSCSENPVFWIIPTKLFIKLKMLPAALQVVDDGLKNFPNDFDLNELKKEIKSRFSTLYKGARTALKENDLATANRCITDYLAGYDEDENAKKMKIEIDEKSISVTEAV